MADALIAGTRAKIQGTGSTTYDGKMCEVVAPLGSGRYLVAVDGYATSSGLRMYFASNLAVVAPVPAPPPPITPPPVPPAAEPWASSPNQRLVLAENWSAIDIVRWGMYTGPGHAKHGLRRTEAWSVQDAVAGADGPCLVCTATWLDTAAALAKLAVTPMSDGDRANVRTRIEANNGCVVTGGMAHRFDALEARYEWRARYEHDPSGVTSPILMTWPKDNASWPDGENDVDEPGPSNTDRNPGHIYLHYGPKTTESPSGRQIHFSVPVDTSKWHTVVFDRTRDYLRIYYDGVLCGEVTRTTHAEFFTRTASIPQHVSMQLDATKDTALAGPVKMFVDYVKVWTP